MFLNHDANDGLLEGDTFFLRPWQVEDAEWYVKARDESIFRWTTEKRDLTVEQTKAAIQAANSSSTSHCFAIVESKSRRLMGNIALVIMEQAKGTGEIMYWLAPEGRGSGLATKSVVLLSNWALRTLLLERVMLKTNSANVASQRVAERAGYRRRQITDLNRLNAEYLWFELKRAG